MSETPLLRQYWQVKGEHPDAILLFRLGDFYEIFFEDAERAAPIMGVTLTSRPLGKAGRHPMCGVPHHSWQTYVGRLLKAGEKVVICDQVEAPTGRGIVRREVTRVLTPGTILEDAYLESGRSNYLVAACSRGAQAGIAACELSTGELVLIQVEADRLPGELARLDPAELLTPPRIDEQKFDPERGSRLLRDHLGVNHLAAIGATEAPLAVAAAGVVVDHLLTNRVRLGAGRFRIRTESAGTIMPLDLATIRNLELGSLTRLIDRTATSMGARRLRQWLAGPLRVKDAIAARQDAVAALYDANLDDLGDRLRPVADIERLTARAGQRLASPRDLVALRRSLEALPAVRAAVPEPVGILARVGEELGWQPELCTRLARALVEDPPSQHRDGGFIRAGYDAELDSIHEASREAREWIRGLEARERERTGIRGLKVGFNKVFGYYLEISQASAALAPPEYIRKQTLSGVERYLTPELKEREAVVLNAREVAAARELALLQELCDEVARDSERLLAAASALADLDACRALAVIARERDWCRPEVVDAPVLEIVAGRHPTVEAAMAAGEFVPNDIRLDADDDQVMILTGPNMAGKSTFLRQVALIVILAQAGSFVPARSARIGLTDRVFTRVGAQDDIASGMSTFMVEMTETANILNHATPRSLVVLDEVGRGTSTYDGISIAQAVVEYLHSEPAVACRTVFATHYHELTALAGQLPRVRNHRMETIEEGDTVRFLRKVVPGGADRSYGIHVAALAGLPGPVISRARQILEEMERRRPIAAHDEQLRLPIQIQDPIRDQLAGIHPDRLTPLEALQKLYELRRSLG